MRDAFSAADADFSGITGTKNLFISEAIHKAFVEVNEEGTEGGSRHRMVLPCSNRDGTRRSRSSF